MKLYEITELYENITNLYEDGDIEKADFESALNNIQVEFTEKLDSIGKLIKNLESDDKALDEEIERLKVKKNTNKIKNLKSYVESQLVLTDTKKVETPLFKFAIQKNPPSLDIKDESNIPPEFFVTAKPTLNKRELLKVIKSGELSIDGVELKQSESLRIR